MWGGLEGELQRAKWGEEKKGMRVVWKRELDDGALQKWGVR